jgi:adenylate cyclase
MLFRGDHSGALAEAQRAIAITPNFPRGYYSLGAILVFSGQPRQGLESIRKAMRLNPHATLPYVQLLFITAAHYYLREYDTAVHAAKAAIQSYPDHHLASRWLVAALAQADQLAEAQQVLRNAIDANREVFEMYVRQRAPWQRSEDYEHMLDGLRKAGWQD